MSPGPPTEEAIERSAPLATTNPHEDPGTNTNPVDNPPFLIESSVGYLGIVGVTAKRTQRKFDAQAARFDQRAGLPAAACDAVARAVLGLVRPGPTDVLLEVGAGTGQIGHHLCGLPLRYVGFDSSRAMLEVFGRRCRAAGLSAELIHADGRGRWPVAGGSVKAVFGSRTLHLLPVDHVASEVQRVAGGGRAVLIVGRVQRAGESVRSRLRRQMQERLRQLGASPIDGERRESSILEACRVRGAVAFEPRVVASWPVELSAAAVLDSWSEGPGLGGVELSASVKDAILAQLAEWASHTFGSLEKVYSTDEQYVLTGVRLPGAHERTAA
jgi:ubiquinone/menaquinone biosynthesis C-methylase UbiE